MQKPLGITSTCGAVLLHGLFWDGASWDGSLGWPLIVSARSATPPTPLPPRCARPGKSLGSQPLCLFVASVCVLVFISVRMRLQAEQHCYQCRHIYAQSWGQIHLWEAGVTRAPFPDPPPLSMAHMTQPISQAAKAPKRTLIPANAFNRVV